MLKILKKQNYRITTICLSILSIAVLLFNLVSCGHVTDNQDRNKINDLLKKDNNVLIYEAPKPKNTNGANYIELSYRNNLYNYNDKAIQNNLHIHVANNHYVAVISGVAFSTTTLNNNDFNTFSPVEITNYLKSAIDFYQSFLLNYAKSLNKKLDFVIKAAAQQTNSSDSRQVAIFNISCLITKDDYSIYHYQS